MKPFYEDLKDIRVDVDDICRETLGFKVSVGFLSLVLIVW